MVSPRFNAIYAKALAPSIATRTQKPARTTFGMSRQLRVRGEFSGQIVARKQRQQGLRDYVACMRRPALRLLAATPLIYALACGGAGAAKTPPEPAEHSLSGLAAQ